MEDKILFFESIGRKIEKAELSQLFGKPCFKINKKAFVAFFEESMVFKLTDDFHKEALSLDNSVLFDPSKKGRPMKAWVQVGFQHKNSWEKLANAAAAYADRN